MNGQTYLDMINDWVVPEMKEIHNFNLFEEVHFDRNIGWFQDGAPYHRRRIVTERLREIFGDQIVSLNQQVEWPPTCPNSST